MEFQWKHTILFLFTLLIALKSSAQTSDEHTITFIGYVSNILTHNPVIGAKAELMTADSLVVDSATSSDYKVDDIQGAIIFKLSKPGNYIIHCTHPDYEESYTSLPIQKISKHQRFIFDKFCPVFQNETPKSVLSNVHQ